jgi:uncharacterized membrane protein YccC
MLARALNTAAGGAIALLAYWLWPTWERTQISETLAALLDRYRDYFRAVSDSYLDTSASMAARLDRTRMAARLGRSNLEAAATRLRSEPGSDPASVTALDAIMANSHRFIHAAMSLEAGLLRSRPAPARPGFRVLADHIDLTLYYLTASLRASKIAPADLPGRDSGVVTSRVYRAASGLRNALERLSHELAAHPAPLDAAAL